MIKLLGIILTLSVVSVLANLANYLDGVDRTFNPLIGKVPTIRIEMPDEKLNEMIEVGQVALIEDIIRKYKGDASSLPQFTTKANMTYILDNEEEYFPNIEFKLGGKYGRAYEKLGYNIKLKKSNTLFNTRNIRLRADSRDYTHMRTKIAADLLGVWHLPSIQVEYAKLYINDEFYGLYTLLDAIKPYWVQTHFYIDENEEVETLFQCGKTGTNFGKEMIEKCTNEKEEFINKTQPLEDLVNQISVMKSIDELDEVMDTEILLKYIASEYLFGSFDHFLIKGHNFSLYFYPVTNKWYYIEFDLDSLFGAGLEEVYTLTVDFASKPKYENYAKIPFDEFIKPERKEPLLNLIYYNDKTRFVKTIRELMVTGFNPDDLFPRINEIADFISPYLEEDFTTNDDGIYPGRINRKGNSTTFTMDMFYGNYQFEKVKLVPGLKEFIQSKFEFVCEEFGFDPVEILEEAKEYRENKIHPTSTATVIPTTSIIPTTNVIPTMTPETVYPEATDKCDIDSDDDDDNNNDSNSGSDSENTDNNNDDDDDDKYNDNDDDDNKNDDNDDISKDSDVEDNLDEDDNDVKQEIDDDDDNNDIEDDESNKDNENINDDENNNDSDSDNEINEDENEDNNDNNNKIDGGEDSEDDEDDEDDENDEDDEDDEDSSEEKKNKNNSKLHNSLKKIKTKLSKLSLKILNKEIKKISEEIEKDD